MSAQGSTERELADLRFPCEPGEIREVVRTALLVLLASWDDEL